MKQNRKINRRQFLTMASGCGIAAFTPGFVFRESEDLNNGLYKDALIKVINNQNAFYNSKMLPGQIENLSYGFDRIKPANHQELAFIVACGTYPSSMRHIIDEYARRKNGKKPKAPDHPILALKEWGLPDTQRILIFKEQVVALFKQLTCCAEWGWQQKYRILMMEDTSWKFLKVIMIHDYQRELSDEEVKDICEAIIYTKYKWKPYAWCSTMVTRASDLVKGGYPA